MTQNQITLRMVCPVLESCEEHEKVSESWRRNFCYTDATYLVCRYFEKWRSRFGFRH